jgi:VIT1/CCC1 family predicted Fe2+/Mn2+ transporter
VNAPQNPYRPPAARVSREPSDEVIERPRGLMILSIVVAGMTAIAAGIAPDMLKSYGDLYKGFGADLPWLSNLALNSRWIWWVLAVAAIGIAFWVGKSSTGRPSGFRRMKAAVGAFIAVFVVVFIVTLFALYLPIFRLGSVL